MYRSIYLCCLYIRYVERRCGVQSDPLNIMGTDVPLNLRVMQVQITDYRIYMMDTVPTAYQSSLPLEVTKPALESFNENGYVIFRNLFSQEELDRIIHSVKTGGFANHQIKRPDGEGSDVTLVLWNHPGDDVTGKVSRCERIVNTAEKLLGGEVYHYHSKLILKEAKTGGAFQWHQDYGYWYKNGCLFPDMLTVFIALDRADRENGCLKILRGSHLMGRVDHVTLAGQMAADPQWVEWASSVCPQEYLELEAGDAAFFHCNLLHRSDQNRSDRRRWGLLCAYNKTSNNPVIEHHCPRYTPLSKIPDSAILDDDVTLNQPISDKDFHTKDSGKTWQE